MCNKVQPLDFHPVSIEDKARYEACLSASGERGCEYSFANLYMWGEQNLAYANGQAFLFSRFGQYCVYPHPVGEGDISQAIEAILAHAESHGNPCILSGIRPAEREVLERAFPNRFSYSQNVGAHDYVYAIDDLADLAGRKYHAKRNHCKKFETNHPNWRVEALNEKNFYRAEAMILQWYAQKEEATDGNFDMERRAIKRAFEAYHALELEGLLLLSDDEVVAVTIGSRLSRDTVDIHYEKALSGVDGAYAMINREFARYLRERYPEVQYLNREEDMGIEGLRRAKESYYPHHRIEKFKAIPNKDLC